jgi:hypothetical protein
MGKNTRWDYGHGLLTGVNTLQQRRLKSDLARMKTQHSEDLRRSHEALRRSQQETNSAIVKTTKITLDAIKNVRDLQLATMVGLAEMDRKLDEISDAAWDLGNYFKARYEGESFLRGLYMELKREMDFIRTFFEDCPEFAIIQLERLQQIIEQNGLTPDRYNFLSNLDDIEKAQNLIQSVYDLHHEIMSSLGD